MTKLYVGKLAYSTTDDGLREAFAAYGNVISAQVAKDRESNQSRGFGFVEMEKDEEAQAAINALDGKELDGRTIIVNVARPPESRSSGGGGYRGNGGGFRPRR